MVLRRDAVGSPEPGRGETFPAPQQRAGHPERRAHVLRRRAAGTSKAETSRRCLQACQWTVDLPVCRCCCRSRPCVRLTSTTSCRSAGRGTRASALPSRRSASFSRWRTATTIPETDLVHPQRLSLGSYHGKKIVLCDKMFIWYASSEINVSFLCTFVNTRICSCLYLPLSVYRW